MGWGGDKYIYPCICITAYSCWAVCSLGPTVLEAEGSALIGKGSLSSHSEAKVSGATAAPPLRSPHQLCCAECTRFSVSPPAPAGLPELRILPRLQMQPQPQPPAPSVTPRHIEVAVPQFPHSPAQLSMLMLLSWLPMAWPPRLSLPGAGLTGAGYKNELKIHTNPPV